MGRKIIELIYVYREQEGYFQIAKECNFEEAEKFRAMDAVNSEFRGRIKEKNLQGKERIQEYSGLSSSLKTRDEQSFVKVHSNAY